MALRNQQLEKLQQEVSELNNASLPRCKEILQKLEGLAMQIQNTDGPTRQVAIYAVGELDKIVKEINEKGKNPNIRDAFKQLHPSGAAQQPFTMSGKKS